MHVLIVEDETSISSFLSEGLKEEGFDVTVCNDGKIGMETALNHTFDVILLDWTLPYYTGIEICTAIRKKNINTPIIFLTARDTVEETVIGLEAGANDYIKKPFHFEELLQRIKVQTRKLIKEQHQLQLKNISIDLNTHVVTKDNIEISLTQKEFALLSYLVKNKGVICKRSMIIGEVWDIHFEYNTGVIDVFMNALRKKLNLGNDELIRTVRGVGYIAND